MTLSVAYKHLNWTVSLKFDNDLLKVPDIKPDPIDVVGVLEGSVAIPSRDQRGDPTTTPITLSDVPTDRIILVILTLNPGTPKDFKPLHVALKHGDTTGPTRDLYGDTGKNVLAYFEKIAGWEPPAKADTIVVTNENYADAKLTVQVAYGHA